MLRAPLCHLLVGFLISALFTFEEDSLKLHHNSRLLALLFHVAVSVPHGPDLSGTPVTTTTYSPSPAAATAPFLHCLPAALPPSVPTAARLIPIVLVSLAQGCQSKGCIPQSPELLDRVLLKVLANRV